VVAIRLRQADQDPEIIWFENALTLVP
jgi:hypothetical protein